MEERLRTERSKVQRKQTSMRFRKECVIAITIPRKVFEEKGDEGHEHGKEPARGFVLKRRVAEKDCAEKSQKRVPSYSEK